MHKALYRVRPCRFRSALHFQYLLDLYQQTGKSLYLFLNVDTISVRKLLFFTVSQPAFDVIASCVSGTSVTWSGLTERTRSMKAFGRITFNIEFSRYYRSDFQDITVSDMSFIGTGMNCNSISSEKLAVYCSIQHIWDISSPRIS